jgi:uncharacterized protein
MGLNRAMKTTLIALLTLFLSLPLVAADKDKPLPKDFKSLKVMAEKGDAEAQFRLASNFYYGEGVKKDYGQSFKWAFLSAAQGNPKAQYRLARLYSSGRGVLRDEKKADALFKESFRGLINLARQNDSKAQYNLGQMYRLNRGVEIDEREAVKWYRKSAEQGYPNAQHNLGVMYGMGKGVEQNYVTAYAWASIVATNGNNIAPRFKSQFLEPKMTPDQIAKAEELVKEMVKKNPKLLNKKD